MAATPATRQDIARWFDNGVRDGKRWMIIVCDTFDWDDFSKYVPDDVDAFNAIMRPIRAGENMQRVMEVYDLQGDKDTQMAEHRAHHGPGNPVVKSDEIHGPLTVGQALDRIMALLPDTPENENVSADKVREILLKVRQPS